MIEDIKEHPWLYVLGAVTIVGLVYLYVRTRKLRDRTEELADDIAVAKIVDKRNESRNSITEPKKDSND